MREGIKCHLYFPVVDENYVRELPTTVVNQNEGT